VKTSVAFGESARWALSILDTLLAAGGRQAQISQVPSLLELQTICRAAGCDFAELNAFARVRDQRPALLLCGGDVETAQEVAKQIGYTASIPELPDAPLVWTVDHGDRERLSLRRGDSDKVVTRKILTTFLNSEVKLDDFVFIEEHVAGDSPWRFVWVQHPQHLVALREKPSAVEILTGQRACVMIADDTPEPLLKLIDHLEQKHWSITRDHWSLDTRKATLLSEVATLPDEPEEMRELRAGPLWNYIAERLLGEIGRTKQNYQIQTEQQEHKLQSLRQTLSQYQRNWTSGVQNVVENHFKARVAGKAFAPFYDVRRSGPGVLSFLSAAGLPALFTKVEQFVMDRMADFAGSLEGMAVRMELQRITFGEMNARWTPRAMGPKLDALLTERRIFQSGGDKPGGLIAKVTGKAPAILEHRKAQIAQSGREITSSISGDFAEWCTGFMMAFEQNIRLQLNAALANQGLPDVDRLRTAMDGFDRLSDHIRHYRKSGRSTETVGADWLRQLSLRRWIPLYKSRKPLETAASPSA
jgi:hypothetical protein